MPAMMSGMTVVEGSQDDATRVFCFERPTCFYHSNETPALDVHRLLVPPEGESYKRQVLGPNTRVCAGGRVGHVLVVLCREVARVRDGFEVRHKRCVDGADRGPIDASKEGVFFDLLCTVAAKTCVGRCEEPGKREEK